MTKSVIDILVHESWTTRELFDQGRFPGFILEEDAVRFWSLTDTNGGWISDADDHSGCWIWRGIITPGGYGQFNPKNAKRSHPAHQFAMYDVGRPPPFPEYEIDHLCGNRPCVNPDHLEWVTHQQNIARGHQRRRLTEGALKLEKFMAQEDARRQLSSSHP